MKFCLVGEGAQGQTYMEAISEIGNVEVVSLAGGLAEKTAAFASQWGIPYHSLDRDDALGQPGIEAAIIGSPSQIHAAQAETALAMGKHVLLEIPMALNIADAQNLAMLEAKTGLTCMVAHTQRFSTVYSEVRRRVTAGELHLHHIVFEIYFFRRKYTNRFGEPRTWTDSLLWHHACHYVDTIYALFREPDMEVWGQVGPNHLELGVPMDLTIGMRSRSGCLVTGAVSFNNHGSIHYDMRFIGEETTLNALSKDGALYDHDGNVLAQEQSVGRFEKQCREFFEAIEAGRKPLTRFEECLPVMATLDRLQ